MKKIKSIILMATLFFGIWLLHFPAKAFCGFYVAKADAKLFNKSSQVIFVRDGNRSVVTMSSDYEGDLSQFAMVIPVPEVLERKNIRIADPLIFEKLDAYSGARLVEYYDNNPCYKYERKYPAMSMKMMEIPMEAEEVEEDYSVSIEAQYQVGEYDIIILSAKESDGLERWLIDNGYKIPDKAKKVLEPYIKNNLKFFVVKVNLEEQKKLGFSTLRPIQIAFTSEKFMLPIRLGMANARDSQDMIVYLLTKNGRVEATNYRTVKIPSDINVPEFIQPKFGEFYKDLFRKQYEKEGKNVVFLEYAWDVSLSTALKCDPCAGNPPKYDDLREAGVFWVSSPDDPDKVFFTRLHVRYDRENFPQDLFFKTTPNTARFQVRYIMQHAVKGNITCHAADNYYKKVLQRREQELQQLAALTGWDISEYDDYLSEIAKKIKPEQNENGWIEEDNFKNSWDIPGMIQGNGKGNPPASNTTKWMVFLFMVVMMLFVLHQTSLAILRKETRGF